jgi:hypothetical protein
MNLSITSSDPALDGMIYVEMFFFFQYVLLIEEMLSVKFVMFAESLTSSSSRAWEVAHNQNNRSMGFWEWNCEISREIFSCKILTYSFDGTWKMFRWTFFSFVVSQMNLAVEYFSTVFAIFSPVSSLLRL